MENQIKIDYNLEFIKDYRKIRQVEDNPKILLHVCCGACSCYPLTFLLDLFDITILYTNSNIYPEEEYDKRYETLKYYVSYLNDKFNKNIKLIKDSYDYTNFKKDLAPFKYEREGGLRCEICIKKRMQTLFNFAKEAGFAYVSTVMSVSRNKNAIYINKVGKELEKDYEGIKFLTFDFKKNNGQLIGINISKKLNIYRQDYCGCEYSIYKQFEE